MYAHVVDCRDRLSLRGLTATVFAAAFMLTLTSTAAAADEWTVVTGVDASAIDARLQDGFRLSSLTGDEISPGITATLRRPRQPRPQWWYRDLTLEEVQQKLAEHSAQLTHIEGYDTAAGVRYSTVMTGGETPPTSWWIGSRDELLAEARRRESRIVDVERHPQELVSAVMVRNGGGSSGAWWLYYEQTPDAIASLLAENGARLVDIEPTGNGLFDAVMVRDGTPSWWYVRKTVDELTALANQNGARLTNVTPYLDSGKAVYAGIMIPNVTRETLRINELMRAALGNEGAWGHYVKRVNGRVIRAINADRKFEPASLIKTLLHLRTLDAFDGRLRALKRTNLTWYQGIEGSCPTRISPTTSSIGDALRRMMQHSDNRATLGLLEWAGGFSTVNAYAAAIGANSTSLNHVVGCADGAFSAPNQLTLRDAAHMLESAANGAVLSRNGFRRFRSLMANAPYTRIAGIVRGRAATDELERVRSEARAIGMSSLKARRFLAKVKMAWKDGTYTLCSARCRYHRTVGGWIGVPFKTRRGRVYHKKFVFAAFTQDAASMGEAGRARDRSMEAFRPLLRRALKSWKRARR